MPVLVMTGASEAEEDEGDDDDALLMNSEATGDALEEFDKLDGSDCVAAAA